MSSAFAAEICFFAIVQSMQDRNLAYDRRNMMDYQGFADLRGLYVDMKMRARVLSQSMGWG
jgi:hypothetical protein